VVLKRISPLDGDVGLSAVVPVGNLNAELSEPKSNNSGTSIFVIAIIN
jgi:hypothetical protein